MAACSPQRFLANNRNVLMSATLMPSSVLPVDNQVKAIPFARRGTAQVTLTGTYTGAAEALYEIEIVDTDVEIPRVSTPVFSGVGSGTITDIEATGVQQTYSVECSQAGTKTATASVQIEGVTVKAAVPGVGGNSIRLTVDQSSLVFTASAYSLLQEITAGGDSFTGQGFDWDCAVIEGNGVIPTTAHRVAFGSDRTNVHLSYKEFVNGQWQYRLVPALPRTVAAGTVVYFVSGGRSVSVTDGVDTEVYPDIVTAYDLLYALRTQSALVVVDGVVANDRTATGQAARELNLRTDAHAEASYGSGSVYAKGVENVTVDPDAGTQLVTMTCVAATSADHPQARLGRERWLVETSLLGSVGTAITGDNFEEGAGVFGLRIPVKLPPGFGQQKGRFSATGFSYASDIHAPICIAGMLLGPDAVDQTITLTYTTRPIGDCNCTGMAVPNLDTACLGNTSEGGGLMAYKQDTIDRLIALRTWYSDLALLWTAMGNGDERDDGVGDATAAEQADALVGPKDNSKLSNGAITALGTWRSTGAAVNTRSVKQLVADLENTIAIIDALNEASPPAFREAGMTAWDDAVTKLQTDIADSGSPTPVYLFNVPSERYTAMMELALAKAGFPVSGGADANTALSGDGCWRPNVSAAYWAVTGSVRGEYAPAYTNMPYYSSRGNATDGVYATHEFAFQINVRCPQNLHEGDTVTLQISDASWGSTYQRGDQLFLPIVAASPHRLSGGVTGDPVQSWSVHASVDGPLAPYAFNPDAPAPYVAADISFQLNEGGIPFADGDRFTFAIEGGHYRWRKDGGAWHDVSPLLAIPTAPTLIDAGLSVTFATGNANSFFAGDLYKFRARQPWAATNVQAPSTSRWKWSGSSASLPFALDGASQIDIIAIIHDLPATAVITLSGDGESPTWTQPLTWRPGIIWAVVDRLPENVTLDVANAAGGSIQFVWAGEPVNTALSAEFQKRLAYRVNRPSGNLQGGRYVGRLVSGTVSWTPNAIGEDDADAIAAMLDYVKANNDEPLIFIPNVQRPSDEVLFARVDADQIEFTDRAAYNQHERYERRVSATIPLEGVMQ